MPDEVLAAPAESAPALEVATVETHADGTAGSSPAGGSDVSPPSPVVVDEAAEFRSELAKARGETEPAKTEAVAELDETPAQEVPGEEVKPEAKPDALSQSESDKPFTERPEWQALTKLGDRLGKNEGAEVRKTLRSLMERETTLAKSVEQARPAQEAVQELVSLAGGSVEAFNGMRNFIRQFNTDPAGAVPLVEKLLADAKQRAGLVIQSPDLLTESQKLEKDLADGNITEDYAKQRRRELTELETHRATLKRTQGQTEAQRQQADQQAETQRFTTEIKAIDEVEGAWLARKKTGDPDFAKVEPFLPEAMEVAAHAFKAANRRNPTVAEAKQILETVYKTTKAKLAGVIPRRSTAPSQPIRDEGTSRNTRRQPMTEQEQFQADLDAARKRN